MNPDKYRKKMRSSPTGDRVRRQIADEAARRLLSGVEGSQVLERVSEASEGELYSAKRQAAAVLGHRVRPGDLPSDHEVRDAAVSILRERGPGEEMVDRGPEPEAGARPIRLGDHLDRFAIYRMRLEPLESVKQNPKTHPEGDALYHSLQVFELARSERPYDEEFLLAALLHDVGKAIEPQDHVSSGLRALEGSIPDRTAWLIEHQDAAAALREGTLSPKARKALGDAEEIEELLALRRLDEAGRVPGIPVTTLDAALEYLRGLEDESYLD